MKTQAHAIAALTVRFCSINSGRQEILGVPTQTAAYVDALQHLLEGQIGPVPGARMLTFILWPDRGVAGIEFEYKKCWAGCCAVGWADTQDAQDLWLWIHNRAALQKEQPILFGDRPKDGLWLALYTAVPMQRLSSRSRLFLRAFLNALPTAVPSLAISNAHPQNL